ncbi:hypothetical protein A3I27_01055 [Candidatus Giovannonibacteria bacterium RIFCSPLOWO2_02_FULL_43_11b]|uniref:Uncharacterized protein n=1 Tax=Candidatus Giovannonibacteria bacterium RIFCSPHIGHO2_12_FULL_43_15 TaxID=1798341 RepID=A0A1F5WPK5_9BACT|nr:MAG: hypothetical protein A2739_01260 [Candidatus Giovannonibacteria bacterium RIFCSPHIGHO2_01_FULL_43_100]OGF66758.1 MAG: hypothetical protein A3B97_02490 [Candidatus Giovannonibacteria bacterium RIFCSPHIGHO2_02_FULL_43_32]OGF77534.1 MAG: hypothetical protein A3F23_00985 [Candidatus Giovannonibacteria bacterium RIFCSPHIGHO2_12_FULL_43_15]OGF78995.1 MAG: hypothetical protein A3A15_00610 [Candidatus Giovannonibacteria bacterium RIFCSPLOWO2_01_FULL_43_60]OGF90391.1 MAG: hypothetical protein A3
MTLGLALLILFLLAYAALFSAVVWHLNVYAFSRKANIVSVIFIIAAIFLGLLSIFFYLQIDWASALKAFQITPPINNISI